METQEYSNNHQSNNENGMMSSQVNELFSALSKAQGRIKTALKDKKNPFFKSNYADLSSVWDSCREALSSNGLSVVQTIQPFGVDGMKMVTILGHSSGQWIKGEAPIILSKKDPQAVGSAITYYRRYTLSSMVGITADEDDDGNAATSNKIQSCRLINEKEAKHLEELLSLCDEEYQQRVMEYLESSHMNVKTIRELTINNYKTVLSRVNSYLNGGQ